MKKILLSLAASAALFFSTTLNAQKISFESSEGYVAGTTVDGHDNWSSWSYGWDAPEYYFQVKNDATATDGSNVLTLISDWSADEVTGVERPITVPEKARISFDIKVENLDGSDNFVALYDYSYAPIVTVDFGYDGLVGVGPFWTDEDYDYSTLEVVGEYNAAEWNNFAFELDFANHTMKYYLRGEYVGSGVIDASFSTAEILDVFHDDYGTGFSIDNIKIEDLATSATSDVVKKEAIKLYPNPVVDYATIDVDAKVNSIEVFDASGRSVKSIASESKKVDLSQLAKGAYTLKVNSSKGTFTKKFIKK